jgi:hypothetical protein
MVDHANIMTLIFLGRTLAPAVNKELSKPKPKVFKKPAPKNYCPGCDNLVKHKNQLCDECMEIENEN